ncbi:MULTISPECIES: TRAP transporter permease [unclassified Desulfovibrio]|uniref:TRAP transporter permease n=1 Tax=unclassified Desulfovibrio TaxID=2593640 RepID=UPI0013EE2309|nr:MULTISPECIES: TRAP transporter permease [unclassified Desulfovibrio]
MSQDKNFDVPLADGENVSLKRTFAENSRWMYLIYAITVVMALFHLAVLTLYPMEPWLFSMGHLQFGVILGFLYYAGTKKQAANVGLIDLLLIVASIAAYLYVIFELDDLLEREGAFTENYDLLFGILMCLVVLELTRRTAGMILTGLLLLAMAYCYFGPWLPGPLAHRGYSFERIISYMFSTFGIFNAPLNSTARFVYLFVLFGAFLEFSGAATFFMNLSYAVAGGTRGGPAKVAVVSSGLLGMMSGAATANVVTTGTMTIPLMIRTGYNPYFAGAVEATASTGGQIVPPVMGAAVFLMAQMMNVSYTTILVAAIIPAILYYASLLFSVDFEAQKTGLFGLSRDQLPPWSLVRSQAYLGLPIIVLVACLVVINTSVVLAGIVALASVVLIGMIHLHQETGHFFELKRFLNAVRDGGTNCIQITATTAAAGIIIGALTLTGLGVKISSLVLLASGGNLFLCLFFTMCVTIVLGMGMPTIAAYAIPAAVVVPALVDLNVPLLNAHLFVLYFAALSSITPPVALASFAAAAIAKCNPFKLGLLGVRLALPAFIIPYMFVYGPELTMSGPILNIIISAVTAIVGVWALSVAIIGYFRANLSPLMRILFFVGSLCMMHPDTLTDLGGIAFLGALVGWQFYRTRGKAPLPPQP